MSEIKKYIKTIVSLKNGTKLEFDPNNAEEVLETLNKIMCNEIESIFTKHSKEHMKEEWKEEVANNKTELSFEEWLSI